MFLISFISENMSLALALTTDIYMLFMIAYCYICQNNTCKERKCVKRFSNIEI